jgi:hypothetical protein
MAGNMARIKMKREVPEPNPNIGAINIRSRGTVQPITIQKMCFFISFFLFKPGFV